MRSNPFERFYDTTATIVIKGDYDDYENTYTLNEQNTVKGDLQPYSGTLLEKDYGQKKECQYRFFCGKNSDIKEGTYLKIKNMYYIVTYVAGWDMGSEVMLKEVDLNA